VNASFEFSIFSFPFLDDFKISPGSKPNYAAIILSDRQIAVGLF
jgi:hypothetical protein